MKKTGAQEYLLSIYQGTLGGIGGFWFYYSYWLVASAFYYTFATNYLQAKDEAKEEFLAQFNSTLNEISNDPTSGRSLDLSHIDIPFIYNR